jgi:hypothetical protein
MNFKRKALTIVQNNIEGSAILEAITLKRDVEPITLLSSDVTSEDMLDVARILGVEIVYITDPTFDITEEEISILIGSDIEVHSYNTAIVEKKHRVIDNTGTPLSSIVSHLQTRHWANKFSRLELSVLDKDFNESQLGKFEGDIRLNLMRLYLDAFGTSKDVSDVTNGLVNIADEVEIRAMVEFGFSV